jgi:PGF-pre-PGF domain-containing protein
MAVSTDASQKGAATSLISTLASSTDATQKGAASTIIGVLASSTSAAEKGAATAIITSLVISTGSTEKNAATSIIATLATSTDNTQQEAATNIGKLAAANTAVVAAITAMFNDVATNSVALANLKIAHQIIVKEIPPKAGEKGYKKTGSPAPIEDILTRFAIDIPDAHIEVIDVDQLPADVPTLPEGLVTHSMFTLTPENFQAEDAITNHVTFFVEKTWLDDNEIHPWSVQFNRYDADNGRWVPLLGKLIREDEEFIFYTVAPPRFSLWAITGAKEIPPVRFQASSLSISPAQATAGEEVVIEAFITNITAEPAEYNAVLWLDGEVHASDSVSIGRLSTAVVSFTTKLEEGTYAIRIDKLLGELTVGETVAPESTPVPTPAPAPDETPAPTPLPGATVVPEATPLPSPSSFDIPGGGLTRILIAGIIVAAIAAIGVAVVVSRK